MSTKLAPPNRFSSVKLSSSFLDEVRLEATQLHRSVAGQIEYWAKLGRAAELALSPQDLRSVLAAGPSFDALPEQDRAAVVDDLFLGAATPSAASEAFFARRRERGQGVGLDPDGRLARALPGGGSAVLDAPETNRAVEARPAPRRKAAARG